MSSKIQQSWSALVCLLATKCRAWVVGRGRSALWATFAEPVAALALKAVRCRPEVGFLRGHQCARRLVRPKLRVAERAPI